MTPAIEQFRAAIDHAGLHPPEDIAPDGELHRFASNGKAHDDSGWYVYHGDGVPAGAFGDWRSDISQTWRADIGRKLTPGEEAAHRARVEAMRKRREAEDAQRKGEAASMAAAIWRATKPAPHDHAYLLRKSVKAHGLRVHKAALVMPVNDADGAIQSLQFIAPDGKKKFLAGGRVQGCHFMIGAPEGALCIAEGYATGASIHEATGYAVAVAFNAGNLLPVARTLRAKFAEPRLIVFADDDAKTTGNPGLTKAREAAQAVGALLAVPDFGPNRPHDATDFNDLRRHAGLEAIRLAIENAKPPADEGEARADRPNDPTSRILHRRASEITPEPARWLWPGRIARGKVTVIAGHPGLGKSQVTISMAAIVSTGGTWPVDRAHCVRGNAVILSAEDDIADTIRPRLEAAGADLTRVYIVDAVADGHQANGTEHRRASRLDADIGRLGALLHELSEAALVIIDPITAYLGDTDSHKNAEVRALLSPLADLAAQHGAAVVCVSHMTKAGNTDALMRVMGSLAFVAAARAAYVVARDKDNLSRRLFLPLKNNLGVDQTGFAFQVEGHAIGAGIETSRVVWEPEAVTVTADEAMTPEADPEERSVTEDAMTFLLGLLKNAPVPVKQIKRDADDAGYSWATIRVAQQRLGIDAEKLGMKEGWVWKLPPKALVKSEGARHKSGSVFDHPLAPSGDDGRETTGGEDHIEVEI